MVVAERIRTTVNNVSIEIKQGVKMQLSVSIGVSSYEEGDTPVTLLKKVDQALYTAKNNGRNQVVCHRQTDLVDQNSTMGTSTTCRS